LVDSRINKKAMDFPPMAFRTLHIITGLHFPKNDGRWV
jgi:hypothetical protein